MKQQLKHVKWTKKVMPDSLLQRTFERACRAREKRKIVRSDLPLDIALKVNNMRVCCSYTINNYAEYEYTGVSEAY